MQNIELRKLLLKIGISSNIQGYHYIIRAVEIIEKQKIHTNITTIYEIISKEFGTTSSRVERAIRHAIKKSYKSKCILNEIYGCIPDNSTLIYDLVFNFDIVQGYSEA